MNSFHFDSNEIHDKSELATLFQFYGSDKGSPRKGTIHPSGWPYHHYAAIYSLFLDSRRSSVTRFLEVGIGTTSPNFSASMGKNGTPGASLRAWSSYFPNSEIFGVDIDTECLFEEERIQTSYIDQTNPGSINEFFRTTGEKPFDVIVDDGMHTEHAARIFFEQSFQYLRPGGLYFIEDAGWLEPGQETFLDFILDPVSLFQPREMKSGLDYWDKLIVINKRGDFSGSHIQL